MDIMNFGKVFSSYGASEKKSSHHFSPRFPCDFPAFPLLWKRFRYFLSHVMQVIDSTPAFLTCFCFLFQAKDYSLFSVVF
jgi:hypothetical protein